MAVPGVDIRQLGSGGAETVATIPADDPLFEGLLLVLGAPVEIDGVLRPTQQDTFLWEVRLTTLVIGECRRCLGRVEQPIDEQMSVVFSADPDLIDDPSVYPLSPDTSVVEVSTAVREELVLRTPPFPLCGEACKGLCPGCGADLNAGPCACAASGSTN